MTSRQAGCSSPFASLSRVLRGHIYFLKAGLALDETRQPPEYAFAWAERVRRVAGALVAENIQIPAAHWEGGTVQLRGFRLPEREFAGHAYRMPCQAWFLPDGKGNPPGAAGFRRPSLERQLHATPFGRFCRHPEVRMALAQDRLASSLAPLLAIPDLLAEEDRLLRDWEVERPEAARQARQSCGEFKSCSQNIGPEALKLRIRLRCAVLRRMDVAAVGREVFRPCPAFFGEPHIRFELQPGLCLKAGMVRMANSWPSPETEALSLGWRGDPKLVHAAESRLFPLPPPGPGALEGFSRIAEEWLAVEPLRRFQDRSQLPLVPHGTIYPHGYVPRGFRIRIAPDSIRDCGGSYLTLAAAGLSPYIAEPFHDYCQLRAGLLAEWAGDVAGLAAEKWGWARGPVGYGAAP